MLIVTRLFFALIFSLGFVNSVFASPMAIDMVRANPKDNAFEVMLASQAAFIQAETNTSLHGIQNNHSNLENVKQKPDKVSKVAEPSSIILLCLGLLGLGFLRRRKH
ncbi:MAG: PEP-CTERM sorting domain-containing protein [Pseudomonadota bacterium]